MVCRLWKWKVGKFIRFPNYGMLVHKCKSVVCVCVCVCVCEPYDHTYIYAFLLVSRAGGWSRGWPRWAAPGWTWSKPWQHCRRCTHPWREQHLQGESHDFNTCIMWPPIGILHSHEVVRMRMAMVLWKALKRILLQWQLVCMVNSLCLSIRLSLSLSLTHSHTLSLTLTHTHTHNTHTHTHTLTWQRQEVLLEVSRTQQ